jgi:hypothetical protein
MLAILTIVLWYKANNGNLPRGVVLKTLGLLIVWAVLLWGLKLAFDALALSDACLLALIADLFTLLGPALILCYLVGRLSPLSEAKASDGWERVFSLLWVPALWFFTRYTFALQKLTVLVNYDKTRSIALLPLDLAGDMICIAALWILTTFAACQRARIPLTFKNLLKTWPSFLLLLVMEIAYADNIYFLETALNIYQYEVLPVLAMICASIAFQMVTLALPMALSHRLLGQHRAPWLALGFTVLGLTLLEGIILLASFGLVLDANNSSIGASMAKELPFPYLAAFHTLIIAAVMTRRKERME